MTEARTLTADRVLAASPVMPIVTVADAGAAAGLASALIQGGVRIVEVTLRTPAALEAVRILRDGAPDMIVGVGTLLTPQDVRRAQQAGAQFLVTPGVSPRLLDAALDCGLPLLPGAATGSEVAALLEAGLTHMKFFPAEQAGGPDWLAAMRGPFAQVRFCPTGGIGPARAPDYLRLPNVGCVGGSWVAPAAAIQARDWAAVTANARAAIALRPAP